MSGPRDKIKTYPLSSRHSLVDRDDLGRPRSAGVSFKDWLCGMPRSFGARGMSELARAIVEARQADRPVIVGLGGHVIKTGCSPYLIDLAQRGLISAIVFNGSVMIHDFELAFAGKTSEDVAQSLGRGEFGMATETAEYLNRFIRQGIEAGRGLGGAVGRGILDLVPPYLKISLLAAIERLGLQAYGVIALGTDILHMHPQFPAELCATGCMRDFDALTQIVAQLDGGVYLNLGSAVLLPEVFLKALSVARNIEGAPTNFTTANLDFIQHYRPTQNVITRPVAQGGQGIAITGHHEILIPMLHQTLVEIVSDAR
ncbi:MAG: deoxyhypusine synthase family protein [Candidatus Alcyoniella australis]|nr:deoxyhypusine synthase family protein [Candidatus Alcyoniella australis]